jgi:hypothetical protein
VLAEAASRGPAGGLGVQDLALRTARFGHVNHKLEVLTLPVTPNTSCCHRALALKPFKTLILMPQIPLKTAAPPGLKKNL